MQITENFSFEEMSRTDTGLPNEPDIESVVNLTRLCVRVLEPARALLDAPLIVHSGYRSQDVNAEVRGSRNSAHLYGLACDFHPRSETLIRVEFEKILNSEIPFDRVMLEYRGSRYWIHIEVPRAGKDPQRLGYIAMWNPDSEKTNYRQVRREA